MSTFRNPTPYTEAELAALYRAARQTRPDVDALMRLLHCTGLRSAEVLQIPTAQVNVWRPRHFGRRFVAPTLRIIGKGDKERVVLFSAEAVRAARDLLPYARNGQLVPWSDRGMRYVIAEVGTAAGVHAHPHRFRHTAITEWVESGTPIDVVADMAGHSSIDVTRLYYAASITARVRAERRRRRWRTLKLPA